MNYSPRTLKRARRALGCAPFQLQLFQTLKNQSVALKEIAQPQGVTQGYTAIPLSEPSAENILLWLIQVGVLRREVDGQGITDSFRLTPLGHQLLDQWQGEQGLPPISGFDRLYNALSQRLRFLR
jgi:hypothetical protein